jgi:putative transposase
VVHRAGANVIYEDGSVRKTRKVLNEPGHAHELTFTCYHRIPLLCKDRTRQWFVEALDRARAQHHFSIWAYVVMPEHAHVLVFPRNPTYDMSKVLQSIKQSVARRAMIYLRRHAPEWLGRLKITWPGGRVEHRFWQQGGGYDRNMFVPESIDASVEYIHNNPVRRELVATSTDWVWSSARWYAGERAVPLVIDPVAVR